MNINAKIPTTVKLSTWEEEEEEEEEENEIEKTVLLTDPQTSAVKEFLIGEDRDIERPCFEANVKSFDAAGPSNQNGEERESQFCKMWLLLVVTCGMTDYNNRATSAALNQESTLFEARQRFAFQKEAANQKRAEARAATASGVAAANSRNLAAKKKCTALWKAAQSKWAMEKRVASDKLLAAEATWAARLAAADGSRKRSEAVEWWNSEKIAASSRLTQAQDEWVAECTSWRYRNARIDRSTDGELEAIAAERLTALCRTTEMRQVADAQLAAAESYAVLYKCWARAKRLAADKFAEAVRKLSAEHTRHNKDLMSSEQVAAARRRYAAELRGAVLLLAAADTRWQEGKMKVAERLAAAQRRAAKEREDKKEEKGNKEEVMEMGREMVSSSGWTSATSIDAAADSMPGTSFATSPACELDQPREKTPVIKKKKKAAFVQFRKFWQKGKRKRKRGAEERTATSEREEAKEVGRETKENYSEIAGEL